jgi:hypothetical protein
MALPKWTDERTQQLTDFVGSESPISQATVANAASELETSTRSVSSNPLQNLFQKIKKQLYKLLLLITQARTHMQKLLQTLKADTSQLNQSKEKSYQWN